MRVNFTLTGITGRELFSRFSEAIQQENVGWDDMDSADLTKDGSTWITAWSGFTYRILNPQEELPAQVEYSGACRGFLTQNLLPEELSGPTSHAEVTEGSVLVRHGVRKFVHPCADDLVRAYGLMQTAEACDDALQMCLATIREEKLLPQSGRY